MSEGLEKVNILGNIMAESFNLEIPGSQREREGSVHSENRFSVELDPEAASKTHLVVDSRSHG